MRHQQVTLESYFLYLKISVTLHNTLQTFLKDCWQVASSCALAASDAKDELTQPLASGSATFFKSVIKCLAQNMNGFNIFIARVVWLLLLSTHNCKLSLGQNENYTFCANNPNGREFCCPLFSLPFLHDFLPSLPVQSIHELEIAHRVTDNCDFVCLSATVKLYTSLVMSTELSHKL